MSDVRRYAHVCCSRGGAPNLAGLIDGGHPDEVVLLTVVDDGEGLALALVLNADRQCGIMGPAWETMNADPHVGFPLCNSGGLRQAPCGAPSLNRHFMTRTPEAMTRAQALAIVTGHASVITP